MLVEEHRRACKDIDACFVLAGLSADRQTINAELENYLRQMPQAYGFAAMHPLYDDFSSKRLKPLKKKTAWLA